MPFIDQHLAWCELRNLRPATVEARRLALRRVERALGVELEDASETALRGWYAAFSLRVQPEGRASQLSHVRQFFRWLQLEGFRDDDPTVRLVRPRLGRRLPRPIPDADLVVALTNPPDRVRPWLHLAAFAGLRAGEIARLARADVMDAAERPVLFVRDGKGGKQRVVPMHPVVFVELGPWLRHRGALFRKHDGAALPAHIVSRLCNQYLHDLGIDSTLHTLRHWFASRLYAQTEDLRLVQELCGHSSPVTTAGYAAWNQSRAHGAVTALTVGPVHRGRESVERGWDPAGVAWDRPQGHSTTPAGDLLVLGR